jgi:hypothetical protein
MAVKKREDGSFRAFERKVKESYKVTRWETGIINAFLDSPYAFRR